jgi:SAM-dependent methyltransferase
MPVTPRDESSFDKAYYDRFYRDRATRVTTPARARALADFVCAYLRHLGVPVRDVLDLGCGLGAWRGAVERHHPRAKYTGVEVSAYLCRRYGWTPGSVVDYAPARPADLVICQGVLQYLPDPDARRAVENLGRATRGGLYLEVLTREDWARNCDRSTTDGDVNLRPAAWYRRLLRPRFVNCGGGVFLHRSSPMVLFELERADT